MSSQTKPRVLIVDNDEDLLSRLRRDLTEAGYEIATTWSGVEALSLLEDFAFDFLLVDDYLPDLYIGDFLQKVSTLSACLRIFVMSLNNQPVFQTQYSMPFTCIDKRHASKILRGLVKEDEARSPNLGEPNG